MDSIADLGQRLNELLRNLDEALPVDSNLPLGLVSTLLLILLARFAAWNRRRMLAVQMLQQIRDSNPHPLRVHRGPDNRGLVVESHPAPEPFAQLMILYTPDSRLEPAGLLRWLFRRDAHTLRVRAMLHLPPRTELIWRHNVDPRAGLAPGLGKDAWVLRTLDFNQVQYSTRGIDTVALEHVFADFQTRFGPMLRTFIVQNERAPHIEIALGAPRLEPLTVAGFLISLRGVGRAARS